MDPRIHFQYGLKGSAQSIYVEHTFSRDNQTKHFTPTGALIAKLMERLAWEDPTLRDLVDYYRATKIGGDGEGGFRRWPISIYSKNVQHRIQSGGSLSPNATTWDEWKVGFGL